jgi:hypothetical protein
MPFIVRIQHQQGIASTIDVISILDDNVNNVNINNNGDDGCYEYLNTGRTGNSILLTCYIKYNMKMAKNIHKHKTMLLKQFTCKYIFKYYIFNEYQRMPFIVRIQHQQGIASTIDVIYIRLVSARGELA